MTASFGNAISEVHVEKWIIDLTKKWFLDYLAESERRHIGVIDGMQARFWAPLASHVRANEWDGLWPDDQLPSFMVVNTGLAHPPMRLGDGTYNVTWLVAAAIVVSTATRTDTRDAAFGYGLAFKEMILQHKSLEQPNHIRGVTWVDSRPAPLPSEGERSLMAIQMFFNVEAKGVLDDSGTTPFTDPAPDPYEIPDDGITIETAGPVVIELEEI